MSLRDIEPPWDAVRDPLDALCKAAEAAYQEMLEDDPDRALQVNAELEEDLASFRLKRSQSN